MERAVTDIADFVIDWEYECARGAPKSIMKHFDKLELLFVIGDRDLAMGSQMSTISHIAAMCNHVEKPVLAKWSFAQHAPCARKVLKHDFINGPRGDQFNRLATYNKYSVGTPAYPCGWLESETERCVCVMIPNHQGFHVQCATWV